MTVELELEHKTDREILVLLVDRVNAISVRIDRQNGRVDRLEGWRDKIVGGLGVLVLAITVGVPLAVKILVG